MEINEEENKQYQEKVATLYTDIMELLMTCLETDSQITLHQFIESIQETDQVSLLQSRYFFDFFLLLHQRSPIENTGDVDEEESTQLLDGVKNLIGKNSLIITELKNVLHPHKRYSIQNMLITIGGQTDAL